MTYAVGAALQQAVYQALADNSAVTALVGGSVYDALPRGSLPDSYVTLGPEDVRAGTDRTGAGAWHRLTVSVVSGKAGFHHAKKIAAAVSDALIGADMTLERGRLTGLHFYRARARREGTGDVRRIDLTFRARVDDTP